MITISATDEEKIARWFRESGGVAKWGSLNLSDPGTTWITPLGASKPHWGATSEPIETVTDPSQVQVVEFKEADRFHVAVRRGSQGMTWKLTDASTAKLRARMRKAERKMIRSGFDPEVVPCYHVFDYGTQEAVIMVPQAVRTLEGTNT